MALTIAALLLFLFPVRALAVQVEIVVEGLERELLTSLLSDLSISRQKDHPYLSEGLVHRLHILASEEIRAALRPFGYYSATVESRLEETEGRFKAVYKVNLGDPVLVTRLDLEIQGSGAAHRRLSESKKGFPLKMGAPLNHRTYEQGKKTLLASAVQSGFLDARYLRHEVQVRTLEKTAQVILHLETGPQFVFGPVTFQQEFLSESYLRGYINFSPGDPFANKVLLELQNSFYDSGQFSRVEVDASREESIGLAVPVKVILEPGPSRKFSAGVGYGTDTGPRFRTGWEHRRINKDVHRVRTDLLVSQIKTRLSGRYTIPLRRPRTDLLDYSAAVARERVGEIDSDSLLLGVNRSWLRGRASYTAFIKYLWENYDVATDEGRIALLIPGMGWNYVRADNRVATGKGFRIDWELQGADDDVLSGFSFLQTRLTAKTINRVGRQGRIIMRAEGGSTWVDDFSKMPATLRFFAGGDQSVRGFAYKSLGPEDASGNTIGGRYLLVGSLEYEHRITDKWSMGIFSDIGNALDDPGDPLERGAGLGWRWQTVIGLVRLDVAWAMSREEKPWRMHLNIGPDL